MTEDESTLPSRWRVVYLLVREETERKGQYPCATCDSMWDEEDCERGVVMSLGADLGARVGDRLSDRFFERVMGAVLG
ncbi:hypothetical protein GN958_ATG13564 [Phytophthora infestans]|uniref:Uncharacterized protein n=1 Tax=Phytophthora infestans TaxID=4787 RepID=A0A8S9U8P3_PHYIN|nr:hypothetical protein GN958_ATG13564 [Phytophthora infestans]